MAFLGKLSDRERQTTDIVLKPSLRGSVSRGYESAVQEWAEILEGHYCVINLFVFGGEKAERRA